MTSTSDPVLQRVRDGLRWPAWQDWDHNDNPVIDVPEARAPVDHPSRAAAIGRRLHLARTIERGGPYVEVFRSEALQRIKDEAAGESHLGPLASFTFAIKDLVAVAGRPMCAGSAVRADATPEATTAPIVQRLEALGAVAMGTVVLHEFAFGVTGVNPFAGTAVNPAAPDRITGGSSSGSAAAVANGSARIAIGTDTGGSIRGPASFCGVVGFKPSFGLYPSAGVFPLSGTLDHVGLFAANVRDIALTHEALGYATAEPQLPSRVGVARADVAAADPDVQELVEVALDRLRAAGCEVIDISLPDAEKAFVTSTAIMFSEAAAIHEVSLASHGDRYGDDIKARLQLGANLTSIEVATAHEYRRQLISEVSQTLAGVDVIVGPTTPMAAPPIASASDPALPPRIVANTRLGNVVGLPAASLPLPAGEGPPVGLQLLDAADDTLLAHAAAVEALLAESP